MTTIESKEAIWQAMCLRLQAETTPHVFEQWLSDTFIAHLLQAPTGCEVTLSVPTEYHADWLTNRLGGMLRRAFSAATGGQQAVFRYEIRPATNEAAQWWNQPAPEVTPDEMGEGWANADESYVPARFRDARLQTLDWKAPALKALQPATATALKAYANNAVTYLAEGVGLAVCGTPGVGKTHLAVAIARRAAEAGWNPLFLSVPGFLNDVRASWGKRPSDGGDTEGGLIRWAARADLLILDDLTLEWLSNGGRAALNLIIRERYDAMKPIIITCGHSSDQPLYELVDLKAKERGLSEASITRLEEMCLMFRIVGKNYRPALKQSRLAAVQAQLSAGAAPASSPAPQPVALLEGRKPNE